MDNLLECRIRFHYFMPQMRMRVAGYDRNWNWGCQSSVWHSSNWATYLLKSATPAWTRQHKNVAAWTENDLQGHVRIFRQARQSLKDVRLDYRESIATDADDGDADDDDDDA